MIIENVNVIIKITGQNKKSYSERLGKEVNSGDMIKVDQRQLAPSTRMLVWCECDIYEQPFTRKMIDLMQKDRTIDSETMCGNECKKEWLRRNNPNPKKDKIKVECHVCKSKKMVNEYVFNLNNFHFCSRDCYSIHKTGFLYEGRKLRCKNIDIECEVCEKHYHIADIGLPENVRHFCSRQCLEATLNNGRVPLNFHYYIYKNGGRRVTWVEKEVEKFLLQNNIEFISEYSIDEVYFSDFYLPEFNTVVEVYGDYWHSNPELYGEEIDKTPLHPKQVNKKNTDITRGNYLKASNYNIQILWERNLKIDFYKELGNLMDTLKQTKILND